MPRKTVTRLRKSCGQLAGHSRKQAARVSRAASDLFGSARIDDVDTSPPDETPSTCDGTTPAIDLEQLQQILGQQLETLRKTLTAQDKRHSHELQNARNLREQRKSATKQLRERLFQLRDSLDGLFGAGGGAKVFEDKPFIPEDPDEVLQLVASVHANLVDPDFVMPQVLQRGFSLDREAAAAEFELPYLQLEEALAELDDIESEFKQSQSTKDLRVDEVAIFVGKVARFYEALYALVGMEGMAQRVRRSHHIRRPAEAGPPRSDEADATPDEPDADDELPLAA